MDNVIFTKRMAGTALSALLLVSGIAQATIPTPGFPLINYDNTGITDFDATSNEFFVDADPLSVTFTMSATPHFVFAPRSLEIRILADGTNCSIIGGNPAAGPDLEIIGDVIDPGTFLTVYSGVLLTGDIVAMDFSPPASTTSTFDFRFTNAAGLLTTDPAWPVGDDVGVLLTSEQAGPVPNPAFVDCDTDFLGLAKGTVGPIPPEDDMIMVDIDVKPGSDPSCFNINGAGVVPVAIFGSATFDVTLIDTETLVFAGLDVAIRGKKGPQCSVQDSNNDGFDDLVCQFEDDASNWLPDSESEATLVGELFDGTMISGTGDICVVGNN